MCLIVFNWDPEAPMPLLLAANRDEFYDRPAQVADYWEDSPNILGGRDLHAGGTWLAMATDGRWAALTNHRNLRIPENKQARSRGELVAKYLQSGDSPQEYLQKIKKEDYNGFNLLLGNPEELWYVSNRGDWSGKLAPGLYGLSNHLLNTPWPKVELSKRLLAERMQLRVADLPLSLFEMMENRETPADSHLPDTGIGLEWERLLGSMFIASEKYGTRCSTVMMMPSKREAVFFERSHGKGADKGFSFRF